VTIIHKVSLATFDWYYKDMKVKKFLSNSFFDVCKQIVKIFGDSWVFFSFLLGDFLFLFSKNQGLFDRIIFILFISKMAQIRHIKITGISH
jgi:hypothetical protein